MRLTVFSKTLSLCLCLGITLATLTGCGIKPSFVDPPQGEAQDNFPRTYPDTATDPAPERLIR